MTIKHIPCDSVIRRKLVVKYVMYNILSRHRLKWECTNSMKLRYRTMRMSKGKHTICSRICNQLKRQYTVIPKFIKLKCDTTDDSIMYASIPTSTDIRASAPSSRLKLETDIDKALVMDSKAYVGVAIGAILVAFLGLRSVVFLQKKRAVKGYIKGLTNIYHGNKKRKYVK